MIDFTAIFALIIFTFCWRFEVHQWRKQAFDFKAIAENAVTNAEEYRRLWRDLEQQQSEKQP